MKSIMWIFHIVKGGLICEFIFIVLFHLSELKGNKGTD